MKKHPYDLVLLIPSTNKEVYYFKLIHGDYWWSSSNDFSEVLQEMLQSDSDLFHYLSNMTNKDLISRVCVRRMEDHEA